MNCTATTTPAPAARSCCRSWCSPRWAPSSRRQTATRGAAFAVAAAVLFAILAVLWLLAARGDRPEYRRTSRLFVTGTAACAALLAGTALLPASCPRARLGPARRRLPGRIRRRDPHRRPGPGGRAGRHRLAHRPVRGAYHHRARRDPHRRRRRAGQQAGQRAHPQRRPDRRRGRLRRLVDLLRLRRTTTGPGRGNGGAALDARPPAADRRYRRHGRRDGQPRRPRP